MQRNHRITIRLTDAEYTELAKGAAKGQAVVEFARDRMFTEQARSAPPTIVHESAPEVPHLDALPEPSLEGGYAATAKRRVAFTLSASTVRMLFSLARRFDSTPEKALRRLLMRAEGVDGGHELLDGQELIPESVKTKEADAAFETLMQPKFHEFLDQLPALYAAGRLPPVPTELADRMFILPKDHAAFVRRVAKRIGARSGADLLADWVADKAAAEEGGAQ